MRQDLPHAGNMLCSLDTSQGDETGSFRARRSPTEILLEIADLVVRDNSSLDLFKDLAPRLQELTGCDFAVFSLHDPTHDCIITHFWKTGKETGALDAFPVDECISGWVWKKQQPMTMPDLDHDPRFPKCAPLLLKHGVRSYASVPMSTAQRRYGALGIGKNVKEASDIHQTPFLSRVAQMVALALENQDIRRSVQEQQERLK